MDENVGVYQDVIGSVLSSPRDRHTHHSSSSRPTDEEKNEKFLRDQERNLRYSGENSEIREETDRMLRTREGGRDESYLSSSSHHSGNTALFSHKGKSSSSSGGGDTTHRPLRNGREEEEEQVTLATASIVEDESNSLNIMMMKEREREGLHNRPLHNHHYHTSAPSSLLLQQLSHNQPLPSNQSPASYCTDEDERMVRDLLKDADVAQAALAALSAAEVAAATASTSITATRGEYRGRANLPQGDPAALPSSAYSSRIRGGGGAGEDERPSDQQLHEQGRLLRRKEEEERLIGRRILETETESVLVLPSTEEGTTVQNIHQDIILNHDERTLHITMDKRVSATAYPTAGTGRDPGLPGMIVESSVTTSVGEREGEALRSSLPSSSSVGVPLPSSAAPSLPHSPTQPLVLEEKDVLKLMQQRQQQSLLSHASCSASVAPSTAGGGGGQERKDTMSPEESPYSAHQQSQPPSLPPQVPSSSSSRQSPYALPSSNSSESSPPPVVSSSSSQPPHPPFAGSSSAYVRGKGPSTAAGSCSFQQQSHGQQRQRQQTSLYHSSHPPGRGTGNGPCSSPRPLSSLGRHSSREGGYHSYDASSHHPHHYAGSSSSSYHQQYRGGRDGSSGSHENHMSVRSRGGRESREIGTCGACDPAVTGDYEGRRKGGRSASLVRDGGLYTGRDLKEIIPLFKSSGLLPLTKAHKDLALRDKLVEFPKMAASPAAPPRDSRRGSESPSGRSSGGTGSRGMSVSSSSSSSSCVRPRESLMTSFDLDHILRLYLTQMAKLPQLQRFSGKWNFRFLFRHSHSSSGHGEAMMVNGAQSGGTAGGGGPGGTAPGAAGLGGSSTFPTSAVGLERELLRVLLREKQARELLRQHHAMWGGEDEEPGDGEKKSSKSLEKSFSSGGENESDQFKMKTKKKKKESCFDEEDDEEMEEDDEDDGEGKEKNRIVLPPIVLPGPLQLREKGMGVAISSSRMHQALLSSFGFGEASELLHKILQPDFHFAQKKRDSRYEDDDDEHDTTMMMSGREREVTSHDTIDSENFGSFDERRGRGAGGEGRPSYEDDDEDEEPKNPISHSTNASQQQSSSLEERELRRLQKRFGKQTYSTVRQPRSCIHVSPATTALHPSTAASAGSMAVCHVEGLVGVSGTKLTGKNEDGAEEEEREHYPHHTGEGPSEGEGGLVGGELVVTAKFVQMVRERTRTIIPNTRERRSVMRYEI